MNITLDIIKVADFMINFELEGGKGGGKILYPETPEELIKEKQTYSAPFFKNELRG